MGNLRIRSASEQVADHLRQQIRAGELRGEMPGAVTLASQLGVNHKTVETAMSHLEREGILVDRGPRRARGISSAAFGKEKRGLKIAIIPYEIADAKLDSMLEIRHLLQADGHFPFYVRKTCLEIGNDVLQLARMVKNVNTDAWMIQAGSRKMLEWFASQAVPTFCLFGKFRDLSVAGIREDSTLAYAAAVRELAGLGHRRIVLLARPERKLPKPGISEQSFLNTLEECGISVSDYHFPLWENSKKGFHRCIEELFRITPPTAIITDEILLFETLKQFLAQRRILVPQDVSIICGSPNVNYAWCEPSIAHFGSDSSPWMKHVMRWASHVRQGKDYRRKVYCEVDYITGGTVGPRKV